MQHTTVGKASQSRTKSTRIYKARTGSHASDSGGVTPAITVQDLTTEDIRLKLLAGGLAPEQIHMPGALKGKLSYIADDFDDELGDFDGAG